MRNLWRKIKRMKVIILGKYTYEQLSATMEELIESSQCYLFTIVCGSTEKKMPIGSLSETWALNNGAPINYIIESDVNKELESNAEYLDHSSAESFFVSSSRDFYIDKYIGFVLYL